MFRYFKKEEIKEDNLYLLDKIKQYNICFYELVGNILSENNDIYINLYDSNCPKFDIATMVTDIFEDVIDTNSSFSSLVNYGYCKNMIEKNLKNTLAFKYIKNKQINLIRTINHGGRHSDIVNLFNRNLLNFVLKVDELIKVKLFNNCIANYEDEKYGYGIKHDNEGEYFEEKMANYYFYFTDSFVSAAAIAYLMIVSDKINSITKENDEFYTIMKNMLNETSDIELVSKNGYELFENLYSFDIVI